MASLGASTRDASTFRLAKTCVMRPRTSRSGLSNGEGNLGLEGRHQKGRGQPARPRRRWGARSVPRSSSEPTILRQHPSATGVSHWTFTAQAGVALAGRLVALVRAIRRKAGPRARRDETISMDGDSSSQRSRKDSRRSLEDKDSPTARRKSPVVATYYSSEQSMPFSHD